ncbi:MAG: TrkH family potassium uptake protein [Clostridiales bacterium]|nr:TrkH family potassium uptake protein [Clostridiales bacterium]
MNIQLIFRLIGSILMIEGAAMTPSLLVSLYFGDGDAMAFVYTMLLLFAIGLPLWLLAKPRDTNLRAREGFLVVPLAWILLSFFGALPFMFSGMIPNFFDALFEAVSGFTTTGASIMTNVMNQPRGMMFWRSFTHWVGGMGVLVLTLAILPKMSGRTSHLVRAESPGPTLSKILPRMGDTAKVLYLIYGVLTAIMLGVLMLCGMNFYDASIHAMGTAGTGGFSNYAASIGAFNSPVIEWVVTAFMVLFGVNFALFYKLLRGDWRDVKNNEELRWFLCIFIGATLLIALIILPDYEGNFFTSLRYSAFQIATIVSTTGYSTADFNLWPIAARMLIFLLLFFGSCAGSTAGGMKICRIGMLCKQGLREVRRVFQPRKVQTVRFEGKAVDEAILHQVAVFACVYVILIILGAVLLSFNGLYDFETNFTAAVTCVSNVGPGLGAVGPAGSFAGYSAFSKIICCVLMLAGRLEIFPILALFHPAIWRK